MPALLEARLPGGLPGMEARLLSTLARVRPAALRAAVRCSWRQAAARSAAWDGCPCTGMRRRRARPSPHAAQLPPPLPSTARPQWFEYGADTGCLLLGYRGVRAGKSLIQVGGATGSRWHPAPPTASWPCTDLGCVRCAPTQPTRCPPLLAQARRAARKEAEAAAPPRKGAQQKKEE